MYGQLSVAGPLHPEQLSPNQMHSSIGHMHLFFLCPGHLCPIIFIFFIAKVQLRLG